MKPLFLFLFAALSGCAGVARHDLIAPSTVGAVHAIESAQSSTQRARASVDQAQSNLQVAKAKVSELLLIAAPAQQPLLLQLQTSLTDLREELATTQTELQATNTALTESDTKVTTLQSQIDQQSNALATAQADDARRKASEAFWRGVAIKLGLLSLGLLLWMLKDPILKALGIAAKVAAVA